MSWTFRCAENPTITTMRWALISRDLTHAVEKAGLTAASCSAVLKTDDPDGSINLPICDLCNRMDHRFLFPNPSSPLQESALWLTCQLVPRPHHNEPWTDAPVTHRARLHLNDTMLPLCYPYPIKLSFSGLSQSSTSTRTICQIPEAPLFAFPDTPK